MARWTGQPTPRRSQELRDREAALVAEIERKTRELEAVRCEREDAEAEERLASELELTAAASGRSVIETMNDVAHDLAAARARS